MEKISAKTRKIKATYSLELAQDLIQMHGIDLSTMWGDPTYELPTITISLENHNYKY